MSRYGHWTYFVALGLCGLWWAGYEHLPRGWWSHVQGSVAIAIALLTVAMTLGGAAFAGFRSAMRRRNARRNPLDPGLRPLVMSDTSWDNCAQAPDFSAEALTAYRFLVEEEEFGPARMDPDMRMLTFRRGDVVVNVGEGEGDHGLEAIAQVLLVRSPQSFDVLAGVALGSRSDRLGEGHRGVAFHLKSHLDAIVAELRGGVGRGEGPGRGVEAVAPAGDEA